ncbi:hypothetical protein ABC970_22010 [Bacillus licheniformis]|uniref:hypothetical protein n=1 Tax=Bacillus TaxID=1386 RepID=UPI0004728CBD|nr:MULTISPECIES: hypothetical protein [Bacillus]ASK26301.1 hypothetical protein BSSX_p0110 [Bacillus subtilis]MCQ5304504.1 hypothetical protein [Bacillus licheniformis]MDM5287339.1 hypothetical protein [Bacillus licheniformis]MEC0776976.1 hypothetical protein [Bacillus licheniformis]MED1661792.1 hypothetical protein [Bacillus licheniformis]
MAQKIKLTKNKKSASYLVIALVGMMVFVFLLTSKITLWDDTPILQTPFNEKVEGLSDNAVVLKEWEYNPKKELMEVIIKADSKGGIANDNLTFFAKEKQNPMKKIPVEVVAQYDDMYVLHINKIPTDYKVVGIVITEKEQDEAVNLDHLYSVDLFAENQETEKNVENDIASVTIYGDYRKVKVNNKLKTLTKEEYLVKGIKEEISTKKEEKQKIDQMIPEQRQLIGKTKAEINELEENKKYQTEKEKLDTDSVIANKKEEINKAETAIEQLTNTSKDYADKIEKLNLKLKDAEKTLKK